MAKLKSPDDLYLYIAETIRMLNDVNLSGAAASLEKTNDTFFTTGSERLGDLGLAVRSIEAKFSLPVNIQERFIVIMEKVNEVWPMV